MTMPDSYEHEVILEVVDEVVQKLMDVLRSYISEINNDRHRMCVVAAALATVAQLMDGDVMFREDGTTGMLRWIVNRWKPAVAE